MNKEPENNSIVEKLRSNLIGIIVTVVVAFGAYKIGALSKEMEYLKKNFENPNGTNQQALNQKAGNPSAQVQGNNQPTPTAPSPQKVADLEMPTSNDHIYGNKNAKIALIEYSDFECPYCGRFHPTAKQLVDDSKGTVMWVYRHFPLTELHPDAEKMAEASECVFDQGGNDAFWKFADILYNEKPAAANFASVVSSKLNLDANKFTACLNSGSKAALVKAVADGGGKAGVDGTPGNFIVNLTNSNVVPLRGAVPLETAKNAVTLVQQ